MLPVLFEDRVKAVIELAILSTFTASHLAFLEQLTASIGIVLNSIEATMQTEGLLKQSQQLATELQTQQKELQQTNEQLAQKAQQLAEQNVEVERKNQEIEQARRALEEKAKELALTSKYKSEFLANMSHELRTPLNRFWCSASSSRQPRRQPDAQAGRVRAHHSRRRHRLAQPDHRHSRSVEDRVGHGVGGSRRGLLRQPARYGATSVPPRGGKPPGSASKCKPIRTWRRSLVTDSKRLQQVLKNLLSNAFKFTEHGGVRLSVSLARSGWSEDHPILGSAGSVVAFEVSDTGIGIPQEKQRIIFEAFQQADAGTSRKYGGTGLGLAISRELASLLGGEIQLRSAPGKGSTFTLYLPQTYVGPATASARHGGQARPVIRRSPCRSSLPGRCREQPVERIEDDRDNLQPGDAVLLIVEDDPHYARVLCDLSRDKGFKVLVAMRGAEALALAREFHPTAVSLDVFLPDMLGWTVLNHLKQDPRTRHIPVQMLTLDEDRHHGLSRGAFPLSPSPPRRKVWSSAWPASRNTPARAASGCWWSKTIPRSS